MQVFELRRLFRWMAGETGCLFWPSIWGNFRLLTIRIEGCSRRCAQTHLLFAAAAVPTRNGMRAHTFWETVWQRATACDSVRQCSAIVENTENRLAPSTRTILWNDRVQARVLYWINMFIVKNRRANGCERGGAGDNEKLNQSFNWVETFTNARRTRTHCHKYLIDLSILLDEFYGNFSMLPKTSGNDVPLCVGGFQTDTRMRPKSLRSLLTLLSDDFSRPPLSF